MAERKTTKGKKQHISVSPKHLRSSPHDFFERCDANLRTLKRLIAKEGWTIEYDGRIQRGDAIWLVGGEEKDTRKCDLCKNGLDRLEKDGRTNLWGCRVCLVFFTNDNLMMAHWKEKHDNEPGNRLYYMSGLNDMLISDLKETLEDKKHAISRIENVEKASD